MRVNGLAIAVAVSVLAGCSSQPSRGGDASPATEGGPLPDSSANEAGAGVTDSAPSDSRPEIGARLDAAVDAFGAQTGIDASLSEAGSPGQNDGGGGEHAAPSGEVAASDGADLTVDRTIVDLGQLDVYAPGSTTLTVTNRGGATSGVVDIAVGEGLSHHGCRRELAPGMSCSLTITAVPTAIGAFSGTVSIMASPGAQPPLTVTVTATATAATFTVSPQFIELTATHTGAPVSPITVTALVDLSDLTITSVDPVVLHVLSSTCTSSLPKGASCTVDFSMAPLGHGDISETVTVSAAGKVVNVTVLGHTGPSFYFAITPSSVQIFAITSDEPTPAQTFTINGGNAEAIAVEISGPDAGDFVITSNDCVVLTPDTHCSVTVMFVPSLTNPSPARSATLGVHDREALAASASVSLVGVMPGAADLLIAPASVDLGVVAAGATGTPVSFNVINRAATATGPLTVSLPSQEFTFTSDACRGKSLAQGAACWIDVELAPVTPGPITGVLTVAGSAGTPAIATLTGTCVAPSP